MRVRFLLYQKIYATLRIKKTNQETYVKLHGSSPETLHLTTWKVEKNIRYCSILQYFVAQLKIGMHEVALL